MTRAELLEKIRNGESSGVDFKLDTLDNRKLAKVLVAFANFQGGEVLLGVGDDGQVSGVTRAALEEWVMTACRDKIRPELIPYFEIVRDVEPGKHVAVVRIESREASWEELERLAQQRGGLRAEIRAVPGTGLEDLDLRRLEDYFRRVRRQAAPETDDRASWVRLLVNTEFLAETDEHYPATVAGMLLFGKKPERSLPQSGVDAIAFVSSEKDYAARERLAIKGPMVALFRDDGDAAGIVEPGIVEQSLAFIRRNTAVIAQLVSGIRRETPDYPEEPLREAIVNALVHRDYLLSGTDIELALYDDRLEFVSPGRLPNGITPERMLAGCRASRNQLIKDVMRDYDYLEHTGLGVPRKIVKGMREHNGTVPDLVEDGERFMVRLWKSSSSTSAAKAE